MPIVLQNETNCNHIVAITTRNIRKDKGSHQDTYIGGRRKDETRKGKAKEFKFTAYVPIS